MPGEERTAVDSPTSASAAVVSLAILKVNSDEGHDYIDGFVPFAAECIREAAHPEVGLAELDESLRTEFGLNLPLPALKTVLTRASREGLVKPEHGIYRRTRKLEAITGFPAKRADALRQVRELVEGLRNFASTVHDLSWSPEQAETALFDYLRTHAVPILSAAVQGEPIVAVGVPATAGGRYVVSAYVLELYERDPARFAYLETLVKGAMLASVLFFPEIGQAQRRFERLSAYFDTPVILRAIGAHGPVAQRAARETIDLAYQLGVRPLCFENTFDETMGVLNHAARAVRRHGPFSLDPSETVEYILEAGFSPSDVELMIARLTKVLSALRIRVLPRPLQTAALAVDEKRFETVLQDNVHYQRPQALQHDLDALTAVHRVRDGEVLRLFENSRAIFVTTNTSLVHASRQFFAEHYQSYGVPVAFSAHHFGTLMWVKSPSAAPELPRDLLVASCYAALNPADSLWQRYLTEIDRLRTNGEISEDDYFLLRFDLTSKSALLTLTDGRQDVFSEGTVPEVLRRARANASRDADESLLVATRRAESAERQIEFEHADQLLRFQIIGNRIGLAVRWALLSIGFAAGAVLAAVGFLALNNPILVAIAVVSVAFSASAVAGFSVGNSYRRWAAAAELGVAKWASLQLNARFGPRNVVPTDDASPPTESDR